MQTQKIINRIDGQWTTCTPQEYNSKDKTNFMFSKNNDTNIITYYKRIG